MISFKGQPQFNVDLAKFAEKLGMLKGQVYQRVALEIWNGVTLRTPVDTGRARSAWNLSIGTASGYTPPGLWKGDGAHKDDTSPPAEPSVPLPDFSKIDGEEVVFITNNLDYIEALENGHSKQAPSGMVFITVNNVVSRIQLYLKKMP